MLLESFLVGRRALCRICGYYRLVLTFRWLNIIEKAACILMISRENFGLSESFLSRDF